MAATAFCLNVAYAVGRLYSDPYKRGLDDDGVSWIGISWTWKKAVDGIYHNKHYLWSSGNLFNLSCGTFPGSDYSFMPREGMGGIYCGVCGIEYNK